MAYKRLLELAENGDIDQLVNGFTEKEGKNFAYFSYATELNNEMEKLQQRIKDLQVCSSPAPRPFMPALENTWGWGWFCHPLLVQHHTRAWLTRVCSGESKGQPKIQLQQAESCLLGAKTVSMLPPCTQQKYCKRKELQESQEPPCLCAGLAGTRNAACCGMSLLPGHRIVSSPCCAPLLGSRPLTLPSPCACVYTGRNHALHNRPGHCREQQPSCPEGAGGRTVGFCPCEDSRLSWHMS